MEAERLQEIEQLFHAALQVESNRRADFLTEACGSDHALRREVESLLACGSTAENFIERPAMEVAARSMAQEEVYLSPGTRLGPYEILDPIGAGGMGEVYKARDTRLDRIIAIKVLPGHVTGRSDVRQRFEREARTIAALNHPHICVIYDIGNQDGTDFLVMEYLEGETLAQRLTRSPIPLEQVLEYAVEIADALDKAHRKGVTHRDLKPGNIVLTKTGSKLVDFGLAKLKRDMAPITLQPGQDSNVANNESYPLTVPGMILGTVQYMAPEQVEGRVDEIDGRSDIFAFGAVIYEVATGRKAFEGQSQASLIAAILGSDPPSMSSLQPLTAPAFERTVMKCLAKEQDKRWQSAGDLCEELKWIAGGGKTTAVISRRLWRERAAWATAVVCFGVAIYFAGRVPPGLHSGGLVSETPSSANTERIRQGANSGAAVPQTSSSTNAAPATQRPVLPESRITGDWHAVWRDADYAPDGNQFFFKLRADGDRLFGTATRVYGQNIRRTSGYNYAISEGKIKGNRISFWYRGGSKRDEGNDHVVELKEFFWGALSGDTIRFTYQVEDGVHPVEFTANRIAGGDSDESKNSK